MKIPQERERNFFFFFVIHHPWRIHIYTHVNTACLEKLTVTLALFLSISLSPSSLFPNAHKGVVKHPTPTPLKAFLSFSPRRCLRVKGELCRYIYRGDVVFARERERELFLLLSETSFFSFVFAEGLSDMYRRENSIFLLMYVRWLRVVGWFFFH